MARLDGQMDISDESRDRLLLSLGEVYLRLEEHDEAVELFGAGRGQFNPNGGGACAESVGLQSLSSQAVLAG